MYTGLHVKCPFSCQILMKLEFSGHISPKIFKRHIFIKIRPVGADLFHADALTDMPKLKVAARDFGNEPRNEPRTVSNSRSTKKNTSNSSNNLLCCHDTRIPKALTDSALKK